MSSGLSTPDERHVLIDRHDAQGWQPTSKRGDVGHKAAAANSATYGSIQAQDGEDNAVVTTLKQQYLQKVVGQARSMVEKNIAQLEDLHQRMARGEQVDADEVIKMKYKTGSVLNGEYTELDSPKGSDISSPRHQLSDRTMQIRRQYAESDNAANRSQVIARLDRRMEDNFDGVCDKLANEFFITGQLWFDYFSPKELGGQAVIFTWVFLVICVSIFSYMAGGYPYWFIKDNHSDPTNIFDEYTCDPRGMFYFLWSKSDQQYTFMFEYLLLWGGRWIPAIHNGQWWRWISSLVLHENHNHIISNMSLFLVLSYFMEQKYGTVRVTLIAIISGLGGNLFSAIFEPDCMLVMGASGLIFGLFGLYITDLLVNFDHIQRPVMQGICVMTLLIYFAWCAANSGRHSSDISHLGGLICGLFPSFLVIPSFKQKHQDWEALLPFIALGVCVAVFIGFPIYIYYSVLPVNCMPS
mmetsp:Transcript_5445/g.10254  ORF Transcript_5445/g.10254 Transcript_5445/m.10254 type:complete len:467 (+) Transcript_5445:975-2375(+)